MRVLVLSLLLAACDEEDFCDPTDNHKHVLDLQALDTTSGDFIDNFDYIDAWDVMPTAVGGVQHLHAGSYDDCGTPLPPTTDTASSENPAILSAIAVGPDELELHAFAVGETTVDVSNSAALSAIRTLRVKPIDAVRLVATELGAPDDFYQGGPFARILLLDSSGQPVVDRDLAVSSGDLVRGQRWNELAIAGATPGAHAVVLHAGGSDWPVTVNVVDGIDAIVSTPGLEPLDVCFHAMRAGQIVGGVPWQIDIDRAYVYRDDRANCVSAYRGVDGPLTATVTARALGQTASVTITFPR